MITKLTVYNPVYHSNIPKNFRALWKQSTNRELLLTDEEIFNIWRDTYDIEPDETIGEDDDKKVLNAIHDILDEKEQIK